MSHPASRESLGVSQDVAFESSVFTVSHLSTDPEGFHIATDTQLRRNQGAVKDLLVEASDDAELTDLRQLLKNDIDFNGGGEVREARQALREAEQAGTAAERLEELQQTLEAARLAYVGGMAGKIGIRNLGQKDGILHVDAQLVPYAFYAQLAAPEHSPETQSLGRLAGASMLIRTSNNRLIVQHRAVARQRLDRDELTDGNRLYCDTPGASVAGLVDADVGSLTHVAGTPGPVTTASIRSSIIKEAAEELGLEKHDMGPLRLIAVAQDKVRPHDDFLLLTDTHLTMSEVRQKVRRQKQNGNIGKVDFEERFIDIEASPRAIETLLCEVECPLAPTHAALFLAVGYNMVLETEGAKAAEAWKHRLEPEVSRQYEHIDTKVAAYYRQYPEALEQVPERFWSTGIPPRNPHGYTPEYRPEEQGLRNFEDEMMRTGLFPDVRQRAQVGYLFDIDGPITDPAHKKVVHPELLDKIATQLISGEPVGLNTGRATGWVLERVVQPLKASLAMIVDRMDIEDPQAAESVANEALSRFCVIGEKGGDWVTFDKNGEPVAGLSQLLKTPDEVRAQIQRLVEERYVDSMFLDPLKRTMTTAEMNDGFDRQEFARLQSQLKEEIQQLLKASGHDGAFRVLTTPIATDVESIHVGKALGAQRISEWMRGLCINPERFLAFGDDESDMDMAQQLVRSGREVKFVNVGRQTLLSERFTVIFSPGDSLGSWRVMDAPHEYSLPVRF